MPVVAVTVVNLPVDAAVAPIVAPFIVPPVIVTPEETKVFNVAVNDALKVVKDPAADAVPPIAGGDARYVLKPVPDTVELALSVVKAPVLVVVAPIVVPFIVPPAIAAFGTLTNPADDIVIASVAPLFTTK